MGIADRIIHDAVYDIDDGSFSADAAVQSWRFL